MRFSKFGTKFTSKSGILQLMDDLGRAVTTDRKMIMLGGGNPGHIPAVQTLLREQMAAILNNDRQFEQLVGSYGAPQGDRAFLESLAALLRREYGWPLRAENIALTTGSQTTFFYLFNMLAGEFADGSRKKILLPLAPEYIGYLDVGLTDDFFTASKPEFEFLPDRLFKYHVDFNAVSVTGDIGAICVSRPTNPTGNVLTNAEMEQLDALARRHNVPLIVDNAYGLPFPNIIFADARPTWNDNTILCMSLSKLGLPGTRTGLVIASEEIAAAISGLNAVISLAPSSIGAALARQLVQSGEVIRLGCEIIQPYYRRKAETAVSLLQRELAGTDFFIHKPEGAFFLWLWFRGLPLTSQQLYERLKQRGVVVVPGEYFFPGLQEEWSHKYECLRMNYAGDEADLAEGIKIIGEEVKRAYDS
ncbi:MAG: Valine--pyruvate aminotransferase [Anaerolineae bacterium]|nr:Valine--pyruvate aminotransferase [Anaerolineae bacterium]